MAKTTDPIISVSGVRGQVGVSLDPRIITRFALAFGTFVGGKTVVVGRDSRHLKSDDSACSAGWTTRHRMSRN